MYYFSVLAIFKNETMNLLEWIEHYLTQGAEHLYMIDNGSTDDPIKLLEPYIKEKKITYYYLPKKWKQLEYYQLVYSAIKKNNETEWLCITDLDEFWYSPHGKLVDILPKYTRFNAIHSNWLMFGSDGHINHPESIRKCFLKREPKHHILTKFIIKVSEVNPTDFTIHTCSVKNSITENNHIRLNHYPIQSLEFYQKVKMTRGACDSQDFENIRDMRYFHEYDQNKTVVDTTLASIIDKL